MKRGTCPKCSSIEVYMTDFSPLWAGESLVRLYNPKGNNLPLEAYLCANCGYMELGVPETQKARIAELVKTDKWKKVA